MSATPEFDARSREAADQIIGGMKMGKTPGQSAADLIHMGLPQELVEAGLARVRRRAEESRILRIPESLVDANRLPDPWYPGVTAGDRFWPALEAEFRRVELPPSAIDSIDNASRKIVGLLDPPWERQIRSRGLVLGYVQSGKTSNFTAVLAKAADWGYRLFIVLSGVHNNLRRQTQARLEEQLVEASRRSWGVSNWLQLTSTTADFGQALDPDSLLTVTDRYFLCVVKKNGRRLENLVGWLESASEPTRAITPILVIDDEADQASVNTAKEEAERTKINALLVRLLSLPKVAYIGYTATPFANLFVDPKFPEDIYPRTFIVDLPRPSDYFGPERLFGRERLEHDDDDLDDGLDVIRRIDEEDLHALQPPKGRADRENFAPAITRSLNDALRYFVLATAARRARGQTSHSTMLIHTTSLTAIHLQYQEPVRQVVSALRDGARAGDAAMLSDLHMQWEDETAAVPADSLGEKPVSFADIEPHLLDVLDGVEVVVDNYRSPDRLHYGDEPKVVIVIGGNTLSRGLTLEGLVVSYFARAANAYDTLLQMGRWFGYRRGYQDLPRIWISETLEEWFRHLATVEAELRVDVARYEDDHVTPLNFGARIRTHPQLAITSALKMRHARPIKVSYAGRRLQTILFNHRSADWLQANRKAATNLVRAAETRVGAPEDIGLGRWLFRDVPVSTIRVFLTEYAFHPNAVELQREAILRYIEEQNTYDDLFSWNVALMGRSNSPLGDIDLGLPARVGLINRARLQSTKPYADIKSLMSRPDRVVDLGLSPDQLSNKDDALQALRPLGKGLVLLYPISKDSKPERGGMARTTLDAVADVIGVGMVFPDVPPSRGWSEVDYVAVDLSLVSESDEDEVEDAQEELERALAEDDEEDYVVPGDILERP